MSDHPEIAVGEIGNYYGCLSVKVEQGKPYWSIENYSGHNWQEIPEFLYAALMLFKSTTTTAAS